MSIFGFGGGSKGGTSPVSAPGPTSTTIAPASTAANGPQPPDAGRLSADAANAAQQAAIRARKKGVGASAATMLTAGGATPPTANLNSKTLLGGVGAALGKGLGRFL